MIRTKYSKEFIDEMKLNASSCSLEELLHIAIYKYKYNISKDSLRKMLSKRKIRYLDYNTNRTKCADKLSFPIGSELVKDDGMTLIKVSSRKWMYKQRYLYERYHNVKLTNRDYIIFLDGNRNNFDKDNLFRLDCRESSYVGNLRLEETNKDITNAAIVYAKSSVQVKVVSDEKPRSHKRKEFRDESIIDRTI